MGRPPLPSQSVILVPRHGHPYPSPGWGPLTPSNVEGSSGGAYSKSSPSPESLPPLCMSFRGPARNLGLARSPYSSKALPPPLVTTYRPCWPATRPICPIKQVGWKGCQCAFGVNPPLGRGIPLALSGVEGFQEQNGRGGYPLPLDETFAKPLLEGPGPLVLS